jgi:hypothetical protein
MAQGRPASHVLKQQLPDWNHANSWNLLLGFLDGVSPVGRGSKKKQEPTQVTNSLSAR